MGRHIADNESLSILNEVLDTGGFDRFVEELCAPYYAAVQGRPSIPPGVYFRMLFVGYFEGLDSQRAIAWRCADSLSLRAFLRIDLSKGTPDHSSMTNTRKRLPGEVFWQVFAFVLRVAVERGLLRDKTIAVDSTTLEANAAMKSLVRRATNEDWKTYVRRLMKAEGIEDPTELCAHLRDGRWSADMAARSGQRIEGAPDACGGVRPRHHHVGAVRSGNTENPPRRARSDSDCLNLVRIAPYVGGRAAVGTSVASNRSLGAKCTLPHMAIAQAAERDFRP